MAPRKSKQIGKKGLPITTKTLDTLCFILDCEVSDIIEHDKTQ